MAAPETTEEQKKAILPFLQRAEEIDKVEPKMAYYCRMYAVEQGLALEKRSAQIDGLLGALLSKLEKDKPALKLGSPADDAGECETFALRVFARADKADRAGRADKGTAMAFYAASVFMEILNQFGPLSPDVAEAQRYAAWKAADIRKALREGRTPMPGPPATWGKDGGGAGGPESGSAGASDLPSAPAGPAGLDRSDSVLGGGPTAGLPPGPPRFAVGDAVFYCPDGHGPPSRGRVSDGPFPPEGLGHTYALGLDAGGGGDGAAVAQAVRAFERQLAPDLAPGTAVTVGPAEPGPDGSPPRGDAPPAGAGVVEGLVDPAAWRPAYKVKLDGAKKAVAVPDTRLSGWRGGAAAVPPPPPPAAPSAPPPPFAAPHPPPAAAPSASPASTSFMPPLANVTEAQKAAKMAASACGFEDIPTAVRCLQDALRLLTVEGATPGGNASGKKK